MTTPREKEVKKEDKMLKENTELKNEVIINKLSKLSEELQDVSSHDEKIELLVKFDNFIKDNKDFIKENCPDKLVSILRSL